MLPPYAYSEEVTLEDDLLSPNIRDVELLIELTKLGSPSCNADIGSRYPGYLYQFLHDRRARIFYQDSLQIVDVYNSGNRTDLPNPYPAEDYFLVRFARSDSYIETDYLLPVLWIPIKSAELVSEKLERSQGALDTLGIRIVRDGVYNYYLFVYEKSPNSSSSGPMRTTVVKDGGNPVLKQPNYGTELAKFAILNHSGYPEEVQNYNNLITIRDMLDLLNDFHGWMTSNKCIQDQ